MPLTASFHYAADSKCKTEEAPLLPDQCLRVEDKTRDKESADKGNVEVKIWRISICQYTLASEDDKVCIYTYISNPRLGMFVLCI